MSSCPSGRGRDGRSLNDQGETVALDVELTPELLARRAARGRSSGWCRRLANAAASTSATGSTSWWQADGDTAEAIRTHADLIAGEVLASSMEQGPPGSTPDSTRGTHHDAHLGLTFWISRRAA